MSTQTAIVIPARYNSSRLKAKPLIEVCGKPIIQWVWEKAAGAKLADKIIVATDNEEIFNVVKSFGAEVEMTSENHQSGSDRIAEVLLRHENISHVVNLQGDEPMIVSESIDMVIRDVHDESADISTLVRILTADEEIDNPNIVKCVTDNQGYALYFSRSRIPYERNKGHAEYLGHLGIYGYKRSALFAMTNLQPSSYELSESLEQLRALQNGMKIKTSKVDFVPVGIDTAEDLKKFEQILEGI